MTELGWAQDKPTLLLEDNQSCIAVAKNPVQQGRIRHVNIKFHYVRECVVAGETLVSYVPTADNVADMFTKALGENTFMHLRPHLVSDVDVPVRIWSLK